MIDSLEVSDRLRRILRSYRTSPTLWAGKPRGITQAAAAKLAGISEVWWRQVELGYGPGQYVTPNTLVAMCNAVRIESFVLRGLGYLEVADMMEGVTAGGHDGHTESHIRATPGLSDEEIDVLLQALKAARAMRNTEPLGRDGWRRGDDN
jgi:hypothetical protein